MPQLVDIVPCWRALGPYVITVTSDEYMTYECDVHHGRCCSVVLDFPREARNDIPCPYTAGLNRGQYADNLMDAIFAPLYALRLVNTRENGLVQDLFAFAMDFATNRHICHLEGPRIVPVAYISVVPIEEFNLAEAEARSIQELGPIWVKRATRESVEALPAVRADKLEAESSCVICMEELKHDQIARMPCRHVFHRDCIAGWLNNSHLCPLCRFKMPAELIRISNPS